MNIYDIKYLKDLLPSQIKKNFSGYTATRLTAPGENYGSLMLRVDVRTESYGKKEILYLVAKCVPRNKDMQDIFNVKVTFKNEIGWYREVIPLFQQFQKENGIKIILDCFPKFYGSRLNLIPGSNAVDSDGVILLENLAAKGYRTKSRFDGFNLETSYLILKHLASFHAVGMALKLKEPQIFHQRIIPYIKNDKQDPTNFSSSIISFFECEIPEYGPLMNRIKEAIVHNFSGNLTSNDIWKTALHNDFWVNNILIKEEGHYTDVAILDLQITSYGSIALDFMFYLVCSVNTCVARVNMNNLIEFYFTEFVKCLKEYKIESDFFSFKQFLEELKLQGRSIFARAMFTVLIILGEKGKYFDATADDFCPDELMEVLKQNLTKKQQEKCCFLVEEFAKRNWI